jgi:hypothetical protein
VTLKIDRKLNLALPITLDNGSTAYVHSMPVSMQVYEAHYGIFARAWTEMHQLGFFAGPQVAALIVRKAAETVEGWVEAEGDHPLIAEVRRLTSLVYPSPQGWATLPLEDAVKQKLIDEDTLQEVMSAICFFTVASRMTQTKVRGEFLTRTVALWDGQLPSLNCTAFASSLPTSTEPATTSPPVTSSVPF